MIATSEKFLARHLGGRFQETMTPAVAQRLGEITVDPKTVKLAMPANMVAAPGTDISGKWSLTVDGPGEVIQVGLDVTQKGSDFIGSMSSDHGGGTVENGKVSGMTVKATVKAEIQGQPMEIQLEGKIEGEKISGTLTIAGLGTMPFTGVKNK